MKYCFTTLAVNEPYESKTANFFKDLQTRTKNCDFFVTTTNANFSNIAGENIKVNVINPPSISTGKGGFDFHLNLKCLSLKHVIEYQKQQLTVNPDFKCYDYVIFCDGDWSMHENFSEEKIERMLQHMDNNQIDLLFERPAKIGPSKLDPSQSFFKDKIYDYDILEHNKWDEAHVVNEQFLVLKNNSKFRFFVQRWEMFLWYSIANNITNYPDGFEIGISALESEMKYEYVGVFSNLIPQCFYFYTKGNVYHERF